MEKTPLNNAEAIDAWRDEHRHERLELPGANLAGAALYKADLRHADLRLANLRGADLTRAILFSADLSSADLREAWLTQADLRRAWLGGADLAGANLAGANLHGANLRGANLIATELRQANLHEAELGDRRIWQIGPIGSRRDYLIIKRGPKLDEVRMGCFIGTLSQFEKAVNEQHRHDDYGREYREIIRLVKAGRPHKKATSTKTTTGGIRLRA